MKTTILVITILCSLLLTGCQYDNYDEPKSILSGQVIFDGQPVGTRTNATRLGLWQDGYEFRSEIPVYIAQDGHFSVALFDGDYKMVRKSGAPWEAQVNDTLYIKVKGNTVVNVPVNPYFIIRNESFQKGTGTITAKFVLDKVVETANLHTVNLYLGRSILTDENKNEGVQACDITQIVLGQETTITAEIPVDKIKGNYLFARIGVRSTASNEFCYTQSCKIELR